MTAIKVKFCPSPQKENSPGMIVLLVISHRIVRRITTDYRIFPSEWDEKHSRLLTPYNARATLVRTFAQSLHLDIERLRRIVVKYDRISGDYSPDDIVTEYNRLVRTHYLFVFAEDVIARLRELKHTGTANNYRATLNSIRRFRRDRDIPLEYIDHILMENYQAYLQSERLTPNSISFYMRIFRAIYNRAVNQELTSDNKPFRFVFTGIEKTRKRAIPLKSLKQIKNLDLTTKLHLNFARDIFLFLFFCRGMSFIDAAYLKKTDIHDGTLTYRRHKTGRTLHIKVVSQIREIIERYSIHDSPFLLPIIKQPGNNERQQYESALRRVNNSLKAIGRIIKLPTPLTTYVTRHTWATIAKNKNVPINIISDALGHDSISTTQVYLASIDTSTIDKANYLVIKDL